MANIYAHVRDRLLVLVLQCAERLQNVELGHAAVNIGEAVAEVAVTRFAALKPERWLVRNWCWLCSYELPIRLLEVSISLRNCSLMALVTKGRLTPTGGVSAKADDGILESRLLKL